MIADVINVATAELFGDEQVTRHEQCRSAGPRRRLHGCKHQIYVTGQYEKAKIGSQLLHPIYVNTLYCIYSVTVYRFSHCCQMYCVYIYIR